jgi:hypothetical protein
MAAILFGRTQQALDTPFEAGRNPGYNGIVSPFVSTDVQNAIEECYDRTVNIIASGIVNYKVTANVNFITTSVTKVLVTGYQVTPIAGTYAVFHTGNILSSQNNAQIKCSIYKGGSEILDSNRVMQSSSSSWYGIQVTSTTAQFNGSETCDVRVSTSQGQITLDGRTLLLIRLGP